MKTLLNVRLGIAINRENALKDIWGKICRIKRLIMKRFHQNRMKARLLHSAYN